MKRFVQTKKPINNPILGTVIYDGTLYAPVFLHATMNQTRPIGHKRTFSSHRHDFYHIVLYTEGRGEYSIEGEYHSAQSGTCVLIGPDQYHDFVSHWEQSVYSEITFAYQSPENNPLCISFADLLFLHSGLRLTLPPSTLLSSDRMTLLYKLLVQATEHLSSSEIYSEYHARHSLINIFNSLIQTALSGNCNAAKQSGLELVRQFIEENYSDQISINELAKLASFSKGHFFRSFKKRFGISPLGYQQTIRIEAAKTLLKTTMLRCNEISWEVGFSDPHFFHRAFKKRTNLTPNQYRKQA